MLRLRHLALCSAVIATVSVAFACGSDATTSASAENGSVEVISTIGSALGVADVDTVTLTISREIPAPETRSTTLVRVGTKWQATLGDIPVGTWRFVVEATSSLDPATVLLHGEQEDVAITSGDKALVILVLQEIPPPPTFDNVAPLLDSMFASRVTLEVGQTATFTAGAHDPNANDTLTWTWSGGAASDFSAPDATTGAGTAGEPATVTTTWTPHAMGHYTISIALHDQKAAQTGMSFDVNVTPPTTSSSSSSSSSSSGTVENPDIDLITHINAWPNVVSIAASNTAPLNSEAAETNLTITANDTDGDRLHAEWSVVGKGCTGTFSPSGADFSGGVPTFGGFQGDQTDTVSFTLTSGASAECTVLATVTDPNGGLNTGAITLQLGATPTPTSTDE